MVFDYTNERTFTDMMIRDFGPDRVEKVNFSAGTSGTKLQLKQYGLSILKQGYKFPKPVNIKDPKKSQLVLDLIKELKHEENDADKIRPIIMTNKSDFFVISTPNGPSEFFHDIETKSRSDYYLMKPSIWSAVGVIYSKEESEAELLRTDCDVE